MDKSNECLSRIYSAGSHVTQGSTKKYRRLTMARRRRANRNRQQQIVFPHKPTEEATKALHRYLDRIYYNSTSGAAFSSPSKLLHEVKHRNHYHNMGLERITQYLRRQKAYTLYRPAKSHFLMPPVHVTGIDEQIQILNS